MNYNIKNYGIEIGQTIFWKCFAHEEIKESVVLSIKNGYFKVSDNVRKIPLKTMIDKSTPSRHYFLTIENCDKFFERIKLFEKFRALFSIKKNIFSLEQLKNFNDLVFEDKTDVLTLNFIESLGLNNEGKIYDMNETNVKIILPNGIQFSDTIIHEYDKENFDKDGITELIMNDEITNFICDTLYESDKIIFSISTKSEFCKILLMDYKTFINYVGEKDSEFDSKEHIKWFEQN